MIDLGFEPLQAHDTIYVQDEPALDLALPQVFDQPVLTALQRGRLTNVEALVAQIFRRLQRQPQAAWGSDYQELVTEFQPLFSWATACWDYLLSTEGCRFIPRTHKQQAGARGDYCAVTDKDYSRLVHQIFRTCVLEFAQQPAMPFLSQWLRERFWPLIVEAYRRLDQPLDPRQRTLTAYSYLRCIPYQFLNEFHQELVYTAVKRLPDIERRAVDAYFLHFLTEPAAAETLGCPVAAYQETLRQGLVRLLVHQRLVYCLLRQIERY